MSTVVINKIPEPNVSKSPMLKRISRLFETVEQRAYDLFKDRGFECGHELDDWLQAERELLGSPPAELINREKDVEVRVALPGFDAKDIEVTVMPQEVVVRAASSAEDSKQEGDVQWSQMTRNEVCRRVAMPHGIVVDSAQAELKLGILSVTATKTAESESKRVSVTAAAA